MDYLPPPLDLQRFPLLVQIHLQNTGFCRFDRELIGRFLGHILDQVDSMPGNEYWLNDNGDGLSFLFWRPETQMVHPSLFYNQFQFQVFSLLITHNVLSIGAYRTIEECFMVPRYEWYPTST